MNLRQIKITPKVTQNVSLITQFTSGNPYIKFLFVILLISYTAIGVIAFDDDSTPATDENLLTTPQSTFAFDGSTGIPVNFTSAWANDMSTRTISNDQLLGTITGSDPYFSPVTVGIMARDFNYLVFDMRITLATPGSNNFPFAQFYFNMGSGAQATDNSFCLEVPLIADGNMHRYIVDMREHLGLNSSWILYDMRFDPLTSAESGDTFALERIELANGYVAPQKPLKTIVPKVTSIDLDDLEDSSWDDAYNTGDFQLLGGKELPLLATQTLLCHDDSNLYIGFIAQIDDENYTDDTIEIFLRPNNGDYCYHLAINPAEERHKSKLKFKQGCQVATEVWDIADWALTSQTSSGLWTGSITIPLSFASQPWKINVCRIAKGGAERSSMNFANNSFYNPQALSEITFSTSTSHGPVSAITDWGLLSGASSNTAGISISDNALAGLQCSLEFINKDDFSSGEETSSNVTASTATAQYIIPETGTYVLALSLHTDTGCYFFKQREIAIKDPSVVLSQLSSELSKTPDFLDSYPTLSTELNTRKSDLVSRVNTLLSILSGSGRVDLLQLKTLEEDVADYAVDFRFWALENEMVSKFGSSPGYAVGQESTMRKVFKEVYGETPYFRGRIHSEINIAAAKNETEGIQLALIALDDELNIASIQSSNLTMGAEIIPADQIEISVTGFISTKGYPTNYMDLVYVGDWPDPLMPNTAFDVPAHTVQPVWVNVSVPAGTVAGDYSGTITITPSGGPSAISIPLNLKVWNFELPKTSALRTALSINQVNAYNYYNAFDPAAELDSNVFYEKIYDFCKKHKLSAGNIYGSISYPKYFPALSGTDLTDWADLFENGQTALPLGRLDVSSKSLSTAAFEDELDAVADGYKNKLKLVYGNAHELGLPAERFYIHAFDEFFAHEDAADKASIAASVIADWKTDIPDLKIECITEVINELIGTVDIWTPSFGMYDNNPASYIARQQAGDELWFYTCLGSPAAGEYPSLVLEGEGIDLRLIPWICKKYNATGFLYYAITHWQRNSPDEVTGEAWPDLPWYPQNVSNYNGEAVLLYPGLTVNDPFISSIRMENFRDGIEDYDYLAILERLTKNVENLSLSAANQQLLSQAQSIIQVRAGILTNARSRTTDPAVVMAEREDMAELICQFSSNQMIHKISANSWESWKNNISVIAQDELNLDGSITGSNPYMYYSAASINAADVKSIVIPMSNDTGTTGAIFWQREGESTWSSYSFPIIADSTTHEYLINTADMSFWCGTITRFRLDPSEAASGTFSVGRIGFYGARHVIKPNSWQSWKHNISTVAQDDLNFDGSITGSDPYMYYSEVPITAVDIKKIVIPMSIDAGTTGAIFWQKEGEVTWSYHSFPISSDGTIREYVIDTSELTGWDGNITRFRLDPSNASSGSFSLKQISLYGEEVNAVTVSTISANSWESWKNNITVDAQSSFKLDGSITGSDPYMYYSAAPITAADVKSIFIPMRTNTGTTGAIFWQQEGEATWSYYSFPISSDGTTREYVIDTSELSGWEGKITCFRFDPSNASSGSFSLGKINFYGAFPLDIIDSNSWESWMNNITVITKDTFNLSGNITGTDPRMYYSARSISAADVKKIVVPMCIDTGATASIFWEREGSGWSSHQFSINADGLTHDYVIDTTALANWNGTITRFRLDPNNDSSGTFSLGRIRLYGE